MSFKSGIIAHKPCWVAKAHRNHRNWVLRMRRLSKKPKQFQEDDRWCRIFRDATGLFKHRITDARILLTKDIMNKRVNMKGGY